MIEDIALDTSVLIPYLKNDMEIVSRLEQTDGISIPFFVIGEVMVGFHLTRPAARARKSFEEFLSQTRIIECTRDVADTYGNIFADLRRKGAMIPVNDIWIAACCMASDLPIATRDSHFQKVARLNVEMW